MAIKQEKAIVKTSEPKTAKEAPKAKAPHDLRRISITSTLLDRSRCFETLSWEVVKQEPKAVAPVSL